MRFRSLCGGQDLVVGGGGAAKRKTVEKVGVKGLDSKVEIGKGTAAFLPP